MRYGYDEDDFDARGSGRGGRRDVHRDADRDEDEDRDGGGEGFERDDDDEEGALMSMTRRDSERDVRDLYNASLDDMRRFLRERESGEEDPMKSVTSNAVVGLEIAAGAALAGFLAQRFRQAGAVVPVGITLAALGLAAAQFNKAGKFSPDLRNVSFGALASAVALWAAGRGAISAEGFTFGPPPGGASGPVAVAAPTQVPVRAPTRPFAPTFGSGGSGGSTPFAPVQLPPQAPFAAPQPFAPQPFAPQQVSAPGSMDFQSLVARRGV